MDFIKVIEIFQKYLSSFLLGVKTTLIVSLSGTIIGFIIGLFVGGIKAIKPDRNKKKIIKIIKRIYDLVSTLYIEIFRGTPMMVQAVFIYYLVYTKIVRWNKMTAAIFVISINTGAYMSEIVRSGIQAVDPGQNEAARALGLNNIETMINVILPQAIKNAFPAIGNELIVNIKDSSVLMIISITELMFQSNSIAGTTYKFSETYFVTAMIYLLLTLTSSFVLNKIEGKLNHSKTSLPQSATNFKNLTIAKGDSNGFN